MREFNPTMHPKGEERDTWENSVSDYNTCYPEWTHILPQGVIHTHSLMYVH